MIDADVLIIGAGISGLAAAQALVSKGMRVKIIEARDRIGGRIHTVDGFDHGAHWIHGTEGNPLTNLAHQHGARLYFVGGDSAYAGGWSRMHFPADQTVDKDKSLFIADAVMDAIDGSRGKVAADASIAEVCDHIIATLGLGEREAAYARWHINLLARDDSAADPGQLSAYHWDEGQEVYGYGDSFCLDGFGALTTALAQNLDIELGCIVTEVRHGAEGVELVCGARSFHGKHAIVTLPLGVLKAGHVRFDPPLPAVKTDAINRLGYGSLAKARLIFDAPFWPTGCYSFGLAGGSGDQPTTAITPYSFNGEAELVLIYGGPAAQRFEALAEDEACAAALSMLRAEFGSDVPAPIGFTRTNWSNDPHALGCYSFIATGSHPRDCEILAQPVGKSLSFAGEATSGTQWAFAHGAYVSGLREAARISADASLLPARNFTENRRWRAQMARASRFFNLQIAKLDGAEIDKRVELLLLSQTFAEIERGELRLLATMFDERILATGDWLCRKGDVADEVFLIATGSLDIIDERGGRTVATLRRGGLTGEYGLFHNATRTASIRATGDCTVLSLDYQRFSRFLNAFPQASFALLRQTVSRFMD
jgi:monoamine oxidase